MNEKDERTKKQLEEIIKLGVEKQLLDYDLPEISDEEMLRSGQPLPPEEILEKIKEKEKN